MLERNKGATMFFIIGESQETTFELNKILRALFVFDHV